MYPGFCQLQTLSCLTQLDTVPQLHPPPWLPFDMVYVYVWMMMNVQWMYLTVVLLCCVLEYTVWHTYFIQLFTGFCCLYKSFTAIYHLFLLFFHPALFSLWTAASHDVVLIVSSSCSSLLTFFLLSADLSLLSEEELGQDSAKILVPSRSAHFSFSACYNELHWPGYSKLYFFNPLLQLRHKEHNEGIDLTIKGCANMQQYTPTRAQPESICSSATQDVYSATTTAASD